MPPPLNVRLPAPEMVLSIVTSLPFVSIVPPFAPAVTVRLFLFGMNAVLSLFARSVPPSSVTDAEPPLFFPFMMILSHVTRPPSMTFTVPTGFLFP